MGGAERTAHNNALAEFASLALAFSRRGYRDRILRFRVFGLAFVLGPC